jgi:hypothetical protein
MESETMMKPRGYIVYPLYSTFKRKLYVVMSTPIFAYDHAFVLMEAPNPPICLKCQGKCNHIKAVSCYRRGLGQSPWWLPTVNLESLSEEELKKMIKELTGKFIDISDIKRNEEAGIDPPRGTP